MRLCMRTILCISSSLPHNWTVWTIQWFVHNSPLSQMKFVLITKVHNQISQRVMGRVEIFFCWNIYPFIPTLKSSFYPTIRSIGRDTKFPVAFFILYVRLQISQSGLYRLAWHFAWWFGLISDKFSPILGDSPRDGRILGVNRALYGGICFLLKHLLKIVTLLFTTNTSCARYVHKTVNFKI